MAKKTTATEYFDDVVAQASVLLRSSTSAEEERAIDRIRAIAQEMETLAYSAPARRMVAEIAEFPNVHPTWKTTGKHNFAALLRTALPLLREALGIPRPNVAELIWRNAELLRGAFREPEYRRVILPFTVLRRLDCLLAPTKPAVLDRFKEIQAKNYDLRMFLAPITGYPFWNHSPFTMQGLLEAPNDLRDNLEAMVNAFSPNVRAIFEKFSFMQTVDKLHEKGRLFRVTQAFAQTPMDVYSVTAHDMGRAFEELLRRFNETSPGGEQYTPRDVIHLMTSILFDGDDEALSVPGVIRTMYDQTAGTGGMLSEGEEKFRSFNRSARLKLFGQELEDETYAICMADMLIRDQDPANIRVGDTLAADQHPNERFDYQLSNPPYGVEWKTAQEAVEAEHDKGALGRFGPGLPRISDGQLLFMLNAVSKMRPSINGDGGGRVGLVHNGSPLFTGDAGSGESEIRRHVLDYDYVDAIVALPTDMFYNTNISTYLWFLSNRKPAERRGKVLLIDASQMGVLMKKNLGKKRFELSQHCQDRITQAYHDFEAVDWKDEAPTGGRRRALKAKVLDASHFFYRKVTIERPLRMRFQIDGHPTATLTAGTEGEPASIGATIRDVEQLHDLLTFFNDPAFKKLPKTDADNLLAALNRLQEAEPGRVWRDADSFRQSIQAADDENSRAAGVKPSKFKAKQFEMARKFFGVRDKKADITTNEKGDVIPDADLRDAEYIPFSILAQSGTDAMVGVKKYFDAEVKPHWPDAWINENVRDESDAQVGLVGCEINFNREFYVYEAPRSREEIRRDIEVMERRFMDMLKEVVG